MTAAIPPMELPISRWEERAPANGVVETVEVFPVEEVAGVVGVELMMFELAEVVGVNEVVATAELETLPVPLLVDEVPEEVEEADVRLVVVAPIAKSGVAAKTSLILPMLTASIV